MNKIRIFLISLLLASSTYAFDINTAINIALDNNFDLNSQEFEVDKSRENKGIAISALMPKIDLEYTYKKRNELVVGQIEENSAAAAVISYNLFNGFTDTFNFLSTKALLEAQKLSLKAFKEDIILNVKRSYISVLNYEKNFSTHKSAYKLFKKQYDDAFNKFNEGLLSKNDLLKVEVNMLEASQNVIDAKSKFEISKFELSNVLGGYSLKNEDIKDLEISKLEQNFSDENLENRSELRALLYNIDSLKSSVQSVRGNYYPKIDTSFSYNKYGNDKNLGGRVGYPDSQEIASVTASWNIFSGGADSSLVGINKANLRQAVLEFEKTKLDIKLQYQKAISEYTVAKLNFKISKKALKQASDNYEIVENRFKEGLSSTTDLVDANYLLSASKQNYFNSYYDKFLSYATLQRVVESN